MTAKRDSKRKPKAEKRPQEAIRDLEPDARQGDVRGGRRKGQVQGESADKPHPQEIETI